MASITSIAGSGMQAAMQQLQASAHNVANAQAEGFHGLQVRQAARPGQGGVDTSVERMPQAGTSLEAEVTRQLAARHAFAASVGVFRTADRMAGALLDLHA